jgi:hypothetical protein
MKRHLVQISMVFAAAACLGVSGAAWAGGGGTGDISCYVNTSSSLGPSLTGTVVIHGTGDGGATYNLEAIFRLKWSGSEKVFRVHVPSVIVASPEGTACTLLAAGPTTAGNETIGAAFGLGAPILKITNRSLNSVDWVPNVPGTLNKMTFADVEIYVIK